MDTEAGKELSENYAPKETTTVDSKFLAIKILTSANSNCNNKEIRAHVVTSAQDSISKASLTYSSASSPYKSPPISPPSSAFVSALQSPYISPRTNFNIIADDNEGPNPNEGSPTPAAASTHPTLPVSSSGSQSDDVPSTSYTPPPTRDNNGDRSNTRIKIVTCVPVSGQETAGTRTSFSFQIPQISFSKGYVSSPASSNARLRTCDVYIGFHGQNPNLIRFVKWLKSELEVQGIACFVVDRAKYGDNQSLEIADRVICSAAFGVAVVTSCGLCNFSLDEIRFFAQKKNLIPLFFETNVNEISSLINPHGDNKECREAIDGLIRYNDYRLEANVGNWRSCISKAACILRAKLGRKSVAEKEMDAHDELLPFPRNKFFVGREREILNIKTAFFGSRDFSDTKEFDVPKSDNQTMEQSECFADRESESYRFEGGKKFMTPANGVVCINGSPGIGKTELAVEFAHRYSQRYKMVFWVGGEARHLRQNILNLSINLGLDVSADDEKERGRIRPFDKQEAEAFKRVKRELFRDMPYLLIIDNLESESEWWEGKDLNDLIPRNTGGTHVIITTRLPKVMNFDMMLLRTLPLTDAMMLIRGRRKKDYPASELEILGKFDEKLGRSSFGLWVVGSLLSELAITPSALFEAVNEIQFGDEPGRSASLSSTDQQFCRTSPFLMKLLSFCDAMLQQNQNSLASRLLQVGAWFAPSPISANLLAEAAHTVPYSGTKNKLKKWKKCFKLITLSRYSACLANQAWKNEEEEESALLLVKLGLARKVHNKQCGGCYIQFHPITQTFSKWQYGNSASKSVVLRCVRNHPNPLSDSDHLWACAFLVFGFKTKPPIVKLKATEMVLFIKRTALPLAIHAFTAFSRCHSALELLKVCTNALEEVEKSFVSRIQDQCRRGSLCSKKAVHSSDDGYLRVDEYAWQEVILLKATLLETRAKLMSKGGQFDSGEELCRTCVSVRTVMLGHSHAQTLDAQETLAKLVRMRSKVLM